MIFRTYRIAKLGVIMIPLMFGSCQEQNKKPLEDYNKTAVIQETIGLYDHYKKSSELLDLNNYSLSTVIRVKLVALENPDSIDNKNREALGKLDIRTELFTEELDRQLGYLENDNMPFESNFDMMNRRLQEYNEFIAEFSIDDEIKEQVLLEPFNYEDFKLSPMNYLMQMRLMISTSTYFILVELLRRSLNIKQIK